MKVHEIQGYITTQYLVEYDDGLLLLDSGCRPDVELIKEYIENSLKRSMLDLKLVVASHAHPDHSGGAAFFKDIYKIPIAAPRKMNKWYSGMSGICTYWIDIILTYMIAVKYKKPVLNILFPRKIKIDYYLEEESPLPFFEDWQALLTPGHTDSDLSLYNEKESMIYVGDMIVSVRDKYIRPYLLSHPRDYRSSINRIKKLEPKFILLAHHKKRQISLENLDKLERNTPSVSRRHRNSLHKIFTQMIKALIKN